MRKRGIYKPFPLCSWKILKRLHVSDPKNGVQMAGTKLSSVNIFNDMKQVRYDV